MRLAIFLTFGPLLTLGALYRNFIYILLKCYSHLNFIKQFTIGIPFGFLTTNILYINQFPDTNSDAKTGKNHLIVTFGKKNARWGYLVNFNSCICIIIPFIIVSSNYYQVIFHFLMNTFLLQVMLLLFVIWIYPHFLI